MSNFEQLWGELLHRELGTDDTANLFTSTRRQAAINEGMREFADLTECFTRQATVTLTGGTQEYDLNSAAVIPATDFVRLNKDGVEFTYTDASSNVTYLAGDDLPRRDIDWLNREEPGWRNDTHASSVSQMPSFYYLRADGPALWLGLTPKPCTGSSASATLRVTYQAFPAAMTSSSAEPFTANSSVRTDLRPYHQALVHYAASKLEKYRRDDQASQMQLQQFQSYIARYFQYARVKGARAISQARSYFNTRRSSS